MRKKGFTLIELLAVLSIISTIMIIAIPSILKVNDNFKEKTKQNKLETIQKAAYNYFVKNVDECININTASDSKNYYECKIKIGNLINSGGYSEPNQGAGSCKVVDPTNKTKCLDNTNITVKIKKSIVEVPEEEAPTLVTNGTLIDYIKSIAGNASSRSAQIIKKASPSGETCNQTLAYDGTNERNLRYIGDNPCNYVDFNGESWRIIGVMNHIGNGSTYETRVKIVRDEPLGTYSWDSCRTDHLSNYGVYGKCFGINDWDRAGLMTELNTDYLNYNLTENKYWFSGESNKKDALYLYRNGIKQNAQKYISNAVWNLGGIDGTNDSAHNIYKAERGINLWVYTTRKCNGIDPEGKNTKKVSNYPATWTGKVALLYPTDYIYAIENNRDECLKNISNCPNGGDNYIKTDTCQRLLNSGTYCYDTSYFIGSKSEDGCIFGQKMSNSKVSYPFSIKPALYLNANVLYAGGNGSKVNPIKIK